MITVNNWNTASLNYYCFIRNFNISLQANLKYADISKTSLETFTMSVSAHAPRAQMNSWIVSPLMILHCLFSFFRRQLGVHCYLDGYPPTNKWNTYTYTYAYTYVCSYIQVHTHNYRHTNKAMQKSLQLSGFTGHINLILVSRVSVCVFRICNIHVLQALASMRV